MDILLTFDGPDDRAYPTGQRARSRPTLLAALIVFVFVEGGKVFVFVFVVSAASADELGPGASCCLMAWSEPEQWIVGSQVCETERRKSRGEERVKAAHRK